VYGDIYNYNEAAYQAMLNKAGVVAEELVQEDTEAAAQGSAREIERREVGNALATRLDVAEGGGGLHVAAASVEVRTIALSADRRV